MRTLDMTPLFRTSVEHDRVHRLWMQPFNQLPHKRVTRRTIFNGTTTTSILSRWPSQDLRPKTSTLK